MWPKRINPTRARKKSSHIYERPGSHMKFQVPFEGSRLSSFMIALRTVGLALLFLFARSARYQNTMY
ncbi:hypothetical protein I7I48_10668 [Histoplasma ohiense]|nr:hypothetical protein I7I48_10668 [Histoplasma ohiense (nom. inval.)]